MTVSALLFDLDGTLLDSDPLHLEVFTEVMAPFGITVDAAFYRAKVHGRHNIDTFTELTPGEDPAAMDRMKERRFRDMLAERGADRTPGLLRLLDRADAAGLPYAVATNAPRDNAAAMLDAIGLAQRIEVVVSAEDCDRPKPAPDPFLMAARRLGADPARALAFEDSPAGVAAAHAAGCRVVGLTSTLSPRDLRAAGAHHTIRDFTDPALEPLLGLPTGASA